MQKYKVITSIGNDGYVSDAVMEDFTKKIEHAFSYGWKLKGGVAVSCSNGNTIVLYQAMVSDSGSQSTSSNDMGI